MIEKINIGDIKLFVISLIMVIILGGVISILLKISNNKFEEKEK